MGTVGNRHHDPKGRARTKNPNIFVDLSKQRPAERRKLMLDQLRNFNAEAMNLDELVALAAFGRQLRAEYEALKVEEPPFVDDGLKAIRREVEGRMADRRATRVREIKATLEGLKSREEKRESLEKELAAITSA